MTTELRIESFNPPLSSVAGLEVAVSNASADLFWTPFYYSQSRASFIRQSRIVAVAALPNRIVLFLSSNSSGSVFLIHMDTHQISNSHLSLGETVSASIASFNVYDQMTGNLVRVALRVFEAMHYSQLPFVLDFPYHKVQCDAMNSEVETDFGDGCVTCPAGFAPDGRSSCHSCHSSASFTISSAREKICGDILPRSFEVEYATITAVVVGILVIILMALRLFVLSKLEKTTTTTTAGRRLSPCSDLHSDGPFLHIMGFVIENEAMLWQKSPHALSSLTSSLFLDVRTIVDRTRHVREVFNTGDHGMLVATAEGHSEILNVARRLQQATEFRSAGLLMDDADIYPSLKVVLNSGRCTYRYDALGNLIVSGRGSIAVSELLWRAPGGCITSTQEFIDFGLSSSSSRLAGNASSRSVSSHRPAFTGAATSEPEAAQSMESSSSSVTKSSTTLQSFLIEALQWETVGASMFGSTSFARQRKLFVLTPKKEMVEDDCEETLSPTILLPSLHPQQHETKDKEERTSKQAFEGRTTNMLRIEIPAADGGSDQTPSLNSSTSAHLLSSSFALADSIAVHPIVSSGIASEADGQLLMSLFSVFVASFIWSNGDDRECRLTIFENVLEALRVNSRRAAHHRPLTAMAVAAATSASSISEDGGVGGSTIPLPEPPSQDGVVGGEHQLSLLAEDPLVLAAAFRLLEVVDMLQTKEILDTLAASR
jgi:hypothetical protein